MFKILNKQNSSGCTPLRIDANELDYAVITNSKEMVSRLIEVGVNTGIGN
jgi:rRNA-processing protein FCF1